jgi:membrane protein involved in colicin uptake
LSAGAVAVVIGLTGTSIGGMNYLYHMHEQVRELAEAKEQHRSDDAAREARLLELSKATEHNAKLADESARIAEAHAIISLGCAESAMAGAKSSEASSALSKRYLLIAADRLAAVKSYAQESGTNAAAAQGSAEEARAIKDAAIVAEAKRQAPPVAHADILGKSDSNKMPYYGH